MKENIGKCYHFEESCTDEYMKIVGVTNGYYDVEVYSMGGLSIFKDKRNECLLDRFWEAENYQEIPTAVYDNIKYIFNNVKIGKYDFT